MRAVYLHGFASTPDGSKGRFFSERLAAHGVGLECPDLNAPDFATLTVTRMVTQVEAVIANGPRDEVVVFGSSLGAFVAWIVAGRADAAGHPLSKLVLLAPAIDFGTDAWDDLGEGVVDAWRETGWHTVMHYGYGEPRRVHYELFADKGQYDASRIDVTTSTLVCMGRRDEIVRPAAVDAFFSPRAHARLQWYDDGHQLLAHLDTMWRDIENFLGLPSSR